MDDPSALEYLKKALESENNHIIRKFIEKAIIQLERHYK